MKFKTGCIIKGLFTIFAMVLVMSAALQCEASEDEEERKVLRVAFPEAEGYTMITEDGKRKGLVVDFLDEISKYTGWEYEYIDVKNDEILDRFEARDFDLMGGQYYMDGYEA